MAVPGLGCCPDCTATPRVSPTWMPPKAAELGTSFESGESGPHTGDRFAARLHLLPWRGAAPTPISSSVPPTARTARAQRLLAGAASVGTSPLAGPGCRRSQPRLRLAGELSDWNSQHERERQMTQSSTQVSIPECFQLLPGHRHFRWGNRSNGRWNVRPKVTSTSPTRMATAFGQAMKQLGTGSAMHTSTAAISRPPAEKGRGHAKDVEQALSHGIESVTEPRRPELVALFETDQTPIPTWVDWAKGRARRGGFPTLRQRAVPPTSAS